MTHDLPRGVLHEARAEDVYPLIADGSVSMVWSDGPYAMGKGAWDMIKPADLPAWYEPHIREWSRICAPSATVYHWGTAEGEGYVREVYRRYGWTFRGCITWEKGNPTVQKADPDNLRMWPDVTEVCGFWQREGYNISAMARGDAFDGAGVRQWMCEEQKRSGKSLTYLNRALGFTSNAGMTSQYFGEVTKLWVLPRREHYEGLGKAAPGYFRRPYDELRSEYEALRSEYEALRTSFTLPTGVTNVWRANAPVGLVRLGHPCHKPLTFVERAIRASSRPGDVVLDPFAGSGGVARVCASLPAHEARTHISMEPDPTYCAAVVKAVRGGQLALL